MEDTSSLDPQSESKLPLVISALAFIFALLAAIFAYRARASGGTAPEVVVALEARLKTAEEKLARFDAALPQKVTALETARDNINRDFTAFRADANAKVNRHQEAIRGLDKNLLTLAGHIQKLEARGGTVRGGTGTTGGGTVRGGGTTTVGGSTTGGTVTPPVRVDPPAPPVVNHGAATVHLIKVGENFSTLARRYGVTLEAIEAANTGVSSNKLRIGQKINIPARPATPPGVTPPVNGGRSGVGGATGGVRRPGTPGGLPPGAVR
ncbi:MAG: LysM peptidoglycan-binding domain-containing protein [Puniceicoccales bacterium]|nr:LysM peptidoglycan-binding domain-containing protein [Puniceicoccales bacterium]